MTTKAGFAAFVAATGVTIALGAGAVRAEIPVASMGEFRLHDGEARLIEDPGIIGPYRICVTRTASEVPLAVDADGIQATVKAGECRSFNARRIRIAAADGLDEHAVLVGTFEHEAK
jgi:hypothetical protein